MVLGLNAWQRLFDVVLPQAVRLIMAPTANATVSLLKDSSLAALIAVPELMNRGQILSTQNFRPLEVLTLVAVLYFVLTWPLALLAGALERRSRVAFRGAVNERGTRERPARTLPRNQPRRTS
jgi:polar amino acid transport system permease protein